MKDKCVLYHRHFLIFILLNDNKNNAGLRKRTQEWDDKGTIQGVKIIVGYLLNIPLFAVELVLLVPTEHDTTDRFSI